MKKEQRLLWLNITEEINSNLCPFCKYGKSESEGCCEGYTYCVHPIAKLGDKEKDLEVGDDCWGFKPDMSLDLFLDLAGVIISQNYDEWAFRRYSKDSITVWGRTYVEPGKEQTSKARIGYKN